MTDRIVFFALSASVILHLAFGFFTLTSDPSKLKIEDEGSPVTLQLSEFIPEPEKLEEIPNKPESPEPEKPIPEPEVVKETVEKPEQEILPEEPLENFVEETIKLEEIASPPPKKLNTMSKADALSLYATQLRKQIALKKHYPAISRRREEEGTVLVHFLLNNQGELIDKPVVKKSSGHSRLDKAALKAVINGAPYPHKPDNINNETLDIQIPIKFYLK